jgi:acyl-coenzyme A synthetase/AMP-(fatty) acid ligase
MSTNVTMTASSAPDASASPTDHAQTAVAPTISTWLETQSQHSSEAPFFVGPNPLSYAEAWNRVSQITHALTRSGLKKGDRLLAVSANRQEVPLLVFACARAGIVFTILNEQTRPLAFERVVRQAEPSLIALGPEAVELRDAAHRWANETPTTLLWFSDEPSVVGQDLGFDQWAAPLPEADSFPTPLVEPSDLAFLVFTSGSTGNPRGVMLTHANVRFVCDAIQARLEYTSHDRIGVFLPLSFDYGLYQIFYAAMKGAALFIGTPAQAGPGLAKLLAEQAITILPGVPTLFGGLAKMLRYRPIDLPNLRQLTNTGDHLPQSVIHDFQQRIPEAEIFPMYGLTECKRVSILRPEEIDAKRDSVGKPLDGTEVFAVDPEGRRLPPGEVGEWVIKGPHVSPGYWKAPEETAKRFRIWPETEETVLFSGDQGSVDSEGYLFFHARSDFMIKHKGHRLSPVELEEAACRLPEVETAGCVKDEARGQLCLFIGIGDGSVSEPDVLQALAQTLEPIKIPDRVILLPSLPRTANQKVDRKALRQWLVDEA